MCLREEHAAYFVVTLLVSEQQFWERKLRETFNDDSEKKKYKMSQISLAF